MDASNPLFFGNFAGLLQRAAHEFGGATAMSVRGSTVSFAEVGHRAATIMHALRARGVNAGDRVAVLLRDPADAAAAFFGSLGAGAVGLNVNEMYRPRQIEYVMNHSGARFFITNDDLLRSLPRALDISASVVNVAELPMETRVFEPLAATAEAPAQITYTSASTGLPKGVVMSHGALWAGVRIVASYLGLRRDDRIASLLPFSFVYGFNQLTTALFVGAPLVVERSTLAPEIVEGLRRERVTVVAGVPPLWQQLLAVKAFREEPMSDLRIMTCAGGRLPPAAVRALRQAQPQAQLFLMYGLTEVFRSTYLPAQEVDAHPDSMGRAIPESTVYVVREDGSLADVDEVGELVHGGPTVGIGYFGDEEATRRVFQTNPFRRHGDAGPARVVFSGDLVRRDANGLLYYVARRDRVIKTLGYRVSPDEITDVLNASGEVADAAVVTEPDPVRGERIVACVVLRPEGSVDGLNRYCRMELPRHMQPARVVLLESVPRNASGKHDIPTLRQMVLETPATTT